MVRFTRPLRKNYWLGLNEFADLSHQEFKNKYLGLKVDLSQRRETSNEEELTYRDVDSSKSVDWRKKGVVTPIKNQGQCGLLGIFQWLHGCIEIRECSVLASNNTRDIRGCKAR
ncbi:cysteine protease XCP2-like [Trifolium pratense]|uniref:Uncharacterized protein n=1 Tax=Trifolium pratense TaxID=57577 RepID=A0ACB0JGJ3_TRIPR|nr:cysteine protease XCP2-like [Trifolium pratense]CAJ2642777.1 unnamed protein product [Trifolium pratense]